MFVDYKKSKNVYDYLRKNKIKLNTDEVPMVIELSNNIIVNDEIIGYYISNNEIEIYEEYIIS